MKEVDQNGSSILVYYRMHSNLKELNIFCLFLLPTSSRSYFPLELEEKYTHYQLSEILVSSKEKSKVGCQYVKKKNLVNPVILFVLETFGGLTRICFN